MSDEPKTLPPPQGDEDLYSASTVVGQAPAELLVIVRDAEAAAPEPKLVVKPRPSERPPAQTDEEKLAALKAAAASSARKAAENEIARNASPAPPVIRPAAAAPLVVAPGPAAPPAVRAAPPVRPQDATAKRPAVKPDVRPRHAGGLPPAVGIVLVFVLAALALAAIVR